MPTKITEGEYMSKIEYMNCKELNISSKKLISMLQEEFNVEVKNHMSVIEDEDAELIKELLTEKEEENSKDSNAAKVEDSFDEDKDEIDVLEKYEELYSNQKSFVKNKKKNKQNKTASNIVVEANEDNNAASRENSIIEIPSTITVKEFAEKINKPSTEVIKQLIFCELWLQLIKRLILQQRKKLRLSLTLV